ncbi:MAG: aspartate/glutamate racemase family protein [Mesorhizobium sp.]
MEPDTPRIALIHALEESVAPAHAAFAEAWPEAYCFDILDTSLAVDRAHAGRLDEVMTRRFAMLADYAASTAGKGGETAGILFTCSAFGPAIDAVKSRLSIPVLRPNEAAFSHALDSGNEFLLIVSFEPSRAALEAEFHDMARRRGKSAALSTAVADGALNALKSGDSDKHDAIVADTARRHAGSAASIILGQFSLASTRSAVERSLPGATVITTPHSAVIEMRRLDVARRQSACI